MKKIALVTPFFFPVIGGTQTVVINIAKQLKRKGYYVEIITPKVDKKSKKVEIYEGIKVVRSFRIPGKILNEIWFHITILPYLKKFDIIHVFHPYFGASGYLAKKFFKKEFNITLIGWDNYNENESIILDKIVKFFSDRADMLFASSKDLIKRAKKQKIKKRIIIIPHGINIPAPIKSKINIRKKYFIGKKTLFIYVGRLAKIKNPLFMVKSWKEIKNKNLFFLIIGDGPLRKQIEFYIKKNKLKNIKLAGFVSDLELKSIYSSADVLIHYSKYESFGLSILEGMAYGLPVIAPRTGAIPELVTTDVGKLINLNDKKEFKEAVEKIPNQINQLKKRALEKAKKYQWRDIIKEYIRYYEK